MRLIECEGPNGTRVFLNPSYVVKLTRGVDWRWRATVDGEEGTEYVVGRLRPDGEFHAATSLEDALLEFEPKRIRQHPPGLEWGHAIRKGGTQ